MPKDLIASNDPKVVQGAREILERSFFILRGGAGSGNTGHAGRPGQRGGSAPGGGGGGSGGKGGTAPKGGMPRTYETAHAAMGDAANASMKAGGRTSWSKEDYAEGIKAFNKVLPPDQEPVEVKGLSPEKPGLPAEGEGEGGKAATAPKGFASELAPDQAKAMDAIKADSSHFVPDYVKEQTSTPEGKQYLENANVGMATSRWSGWGGQEQMMAYQKAYQEIGTPDAMERASRIGEWLKEEGTAPGKVPLPTTAEEASANAGKLGLGNEPRSADPFGDALGAVKGEKASAVWTSAGHLIAGSLGHDVNRVDQAFMLGLEDSNWHDRTAEINDLWLPKGYAGKYATLDEVKADEATHPEAAALTHWGRPQEEENLAKASKSLHVKAIVKATGGGGK